MENEILLGEITRAPSYEFLESLPYEDRDEARKNAFGDIRGDNGCTYIFYPRISQYCAEGDIVSFSSDDVCYEGAQYLSAKNVRKIGHRTNTTNISNISNISNTKPSKNTLVRIGSIAVKIKDVKSASVSGNENNAKLLIRTYSSGTLVGCYKPDYDNYGTFRQADELADADLELLLGYLS